ncbi:MAG: gfo/Idh/MocA family oxidoreductase, partial [Candidatus Hinthialibacter sp.]
MGNQTNFNRRTFLGATASSFTILPRHLLGGPSYVPPSEKVNIAYIGCGTQGIRQLIQALPNPDVH